MQTSNGELVQLVLGQPFDCAAAYAALLWSEQQLSPRNFKGLKNFEFHLDDSLSVIFRWRRFTKSK
jgi:hypothetical protein